jgi:hypothetical protein
MELSLVTIPANAEATITGIKSIDTQLRAASGQTRKSVVLLKSETPAKRKGIKLIPPASRHG